MTHPKIAVRTILAALLLDAVAGLLYSAVTPHLPWWHGLYCAVANAVTVGGDVSPVNGWGYLINAAECVLVVPLFAATFSLFTSGLTSVHVNASEERVKTHIADQMKAGTGDMTE